MKIKPSTLALLAGAGLLVLLVLMQVTLFLSLQKQAKESRDAVAHSVYILDETETFLSKIKDGELAERNFLLTNQPQYLNPFRAAFGLGSTGFGRDRLMGSDQRDALEVVDNLMKLTNDNGYQQAKLKQLQAVVQAKIAHSMERLRPALEGKRPPPMVPLIRQADFDYTSDIRSLTTSIIKHEQGRLQDRGDADKATETRLYYFVGGAALATYVVILLMIVLVIGSLRRLSRKTSELSTQESYFRAAAEGGLNAFFIFRFIPSEVDGKLTLSLDYLNSLAANLVGMTAEEAYDRPSGSMIETLRHLHDDPDDRYMRVVAERMAQESEFMVLRGVLAGRYFQEQIVPLPGGIAISCRDITERRLIDKMKGEFISTVSHELRTPLTAIRGSLGLIAGGAVGIISQEIASLIQVAYSNCERLTRLINDILDIEKIESGRMRYQLRPVSLSEILQDAIAQNATIADRAGVRLRLEAPLTCTDILVMADPDRLMQVITNLLSNALKFSPIGGTVTLRSSIEKGRGRVSISDQGPGIPLAFQDQIFKKFAQADGSASRQKGGTGLGLSIAKAIIDEMHGAIGFDSPEGQGTVFFFDLPLPPDETAVPAPAIVPAIAPPIASVPRQTKAAPTAHRLLICEDEADIANLLSLALNGAGVVCDIAPDAATAIKMLRNGSYMAMTLDLLLPDKSGIDLIRDIRADPALAHLPIIVVSAKAEGGQQKLKGDAVGVLGWMSKPIDTDRLVALITELRTGDGPQRILHVEDDPGIQEILRHSLGTDADLSVATTLAEARQMLAGGNFDLVILDVGLPDGNGLDLLSVLGTGRQFPIPVMLFTARDVPADIAAQVEATLIKSKTSEEKLLQTIRHLMPKRERALS